MQIYAYATLIFYLINAMAIQYGYIIIQSRVVCSHQGKYYASQKENEKITNVWSVHQCGFIQNQIFVKDIEGQSTTTALFCPVLYFFPLRISDETTGWSVYIHEQFLYSKNMTNFKPFHGLFLDISSKIILFSEVSMYIFSSQAMHVDKLPTHIISAILQVRIFKLL